LCRYFEAYENIAPDFLAQVWLGDGFVGQFHFKRSTDIPYHLDVPISELAPGGTDLLLHKQGPGRMYYRLALNYARLDGEIAPLDRGFRVSRRYEPVEAVEDVRRNATGAWLIRAGATVRVRLTLTTPMLRHHVALVDPLPAGLEPLNPAIVVTAGPNEQAVFGTHRCGSRPAWFDHQNLRDDRAEAFTSMLREGVYEYVYLARATTPGRFAAPPPKVEEMYHPQTFGRGAGDIMIIHGDPMTMAKEDSV
jgi:hypothetical protein